MGSHVTESLPAEKLKALAGRVLDIESRAVSQMAAQLDDAFVEA